MAQCRGRLPATAASRALHRADYGMDGVVAVVPHGRGSGRKSGSTARNGADRGGRLGADGLHRHGLHKPIGALLEDAPAKELLGSGDLGYTIPAEIVYPKYFHKAGALCAARTGNDVNPQKESSATQFYIVTGKYFTSMELDKMEKKDNIKFTPEQREAYMMQGGYPQLDQEYTVFGEVISGMKVVNKIQMVETDENDRPIEDIRIKSMKIVKK